MNRRWMEQRGACALAIFAVLALAITALVEAAVSLHPADPGASGFQVDGTESFTPGSVLTLTDSSVSGFIGFFANESAAAGIEIDVIATFQVRLTGANGADTGNRLVINDGLNCSAIAECIFKNFVPGIGLYSSGPVSDAASYPVFVPVDWAASPVTIRLRRTAAGDAEIVEVNGVAPSPRALLTADKTPQQTRPGASVEFGAAGIEATATVDYVAFRSERVVSPVAGTLLFTQFRLRDSDSVDRLRFRADYTLGSGSDGINPAVEPVTIKLSTPDGGQFYPSPDCNPLVGFNVQGRVPRRRWRLNDSERAGTSIEQLVFDEDPNNSGGIFLRDFRATLADADFSTVNVEITIGTGAAQNKLTATVQPVNKPAGSGQWRLTTEP